VRKAHAKAQRRKDFLCVFASWREILYSVYLRLSSLISLLRMIPNNWLDWLTVLGYVGLSVFITWRVLGTQKK
jgi:hypothetical protein